MFWIGPVAFGSRSDEAFLRQATSTRVHPFAAVARSRRTFPNAEARILDESPLVTGIKWFATGSAVTAAFIVSLDAGRRLTGFGFVIFVASAIAWIAAALLSEDWALGTQNAVLLVINLLGVYRYLIRKKGVD